MKRRLILIAVILLCAAAAISAPTMTEMVPMRDGTKLVTDIYLPAAPGKYPALLARTPYSRDFGNTGFADETGRGYAVIVQNTRGRFGSEGGENFVFTDDAWGKNQDGYDTVEWIASQSWCNGKVGTFGGSAVGITQIMMAGSAPPHLVCQVIDVAPADLYNQCFFNGGALRRETVVPWMKACGFPQSYTDILNSNPAYDDFWRQLDLNTRFEDVKAPILQIGGWYDIFLQGTIDVFTGVQNHGREGARGNQKLIIGPWNHGFSAKAGKYEFPTGDFKTSTIKNAWFDWWLKSEGKNEQPAVTYYTMGALGEEGAPGNEWHTADSWPIPAKTTPFYLRKGSRLTLDEPWEMTAQKTFAYDPNDPVPTIGGANLTLPTGTMDQRPDEIRKDVLIFTTSPLEEPLNVTGRIKVKLYASSSAKDTDFTAKLTDVYPDGRSMLICDGVIKARYRNSFEKPKLMRPGKVYEFEIDLWSTSMIFNKGHRIRLAISSSNYERYDVNPNTGGSAFNPSSMQTADNTIYFDASHPSAIYLPVAEP